MESNICTNSILSVLLLLLLQVISPVYSQKSLGGEQFDCQIPKGVSGKCVEISKCLDFARSLLTTSEGRMQEANYEYLKQLRCGFQGKDPMICCPVNGTGVDSGASGNGTTNFSTLDLSSNELLPRSCGLFLSNRILGGYKANLGNYPWLAILEYQTPTGRSLQTCGGVLISKRYVLTAAHCLKGKEIQKSWKLVGTRLGEYDTRTTKDCETIALDDLFCGDDPVTVDVEEEIVHEGYIPESREQPNDIALIRLSRDVNFTEYIMPICLPQKASKTEKKLFHIAGWGISARLSESAVKIHRRIPMIDHANCTMIYQGHLVKINEDQICTGREKGLVPCAGDSGGPLMNVNFNDVPQEQWTVDGIASLGSPCGNHGTPGVFTRVTSFVPWIISKMRV